MKAREKRKQKKAEQSGEFKTTDPEDEEMKAVEKAGFLDPLVDPEKNLERLGARVAEDGQCSREEEMEINGHINGRPSCESLGITQSIDDMLAVDQVIYRQGNYY